MRDDLLDAQAAVDWAAAEIPLFQQKITDWNRKRPYDIVAERDSDTGKNFLIAYSLGPLDPIINAGAGAIINNIRAALDLLAASLARRNGVKPSADTHFPIFASEQEMIDPLKGIEGKKWLSKRERATIKSLKPYNGGDETLWPLHQLDIARKHYKLIDIGVRIADLWLTHYPRTQLPKIRLDDKAILFEIPASANLVATEGNSNLTLEVTFDEARFGLPEAPAIETMRKFASRVAEIIKLFDTR
jgi:hypothetical protein